jgi:chorismate mutase/prephenate dehydratase
MITEKLYYLGPEASYSNQAAQKYSDTIKDLKSDTKLELIPTDTINGVFAALSNDTTGQSFGVVPIENSIAGDVGDTFQNLFSQNYYISGEVILPIEHVLAAKSQISVQSITKLYSHSQALFQCSNFLEGLGNIEMVRADSTSKAAAVVRENDDNSFACICSRMAAQRYNLEIIKTRISDMATNFTRFVVISFATQRYSSVHATRTRKYTALFSIQNEVGSLVDVLLELKKQDLNMSKIESKPIPDKPWEYQFFVEFIGGSIELDTLQNKVGRFEIIGEFEI